MGKSSSSTVLFELRSSQSSHSSLSGKLNWFRAMNDGPGQTPPHALPRKNVRRCVCPIFRRAGGKWMVLFCWEKVSCVSFVCLYRCVHV